MLARVGRFCQSEDASATRALGNSVEVGDTSVQMAFPVDA
ncbi:predicted protein [Streptomyces iranensis]|uniref:Uncharacterized protein n=1 Tax=Streptomyces iranensis TaxID=576784 RepID=A0A060ZBK3_9ACTN|nr:hypothetical protein [Streptomyces iranensis]CDR01613.1 predicted protein [Streptomyces iranensis]